MIAENPNPRGGDLLKTPRAPAEVLIHSLVPARHVGAAARAVPRPRVTLLVAVAVAAPTGFKLPPANPGSALLTAR
jgi:hypothetical protein